MWTSSNDKEHSKEADKSLTWGNSSRSLFTFSQLSYFFSHIQPVRGSFSIFKRIFSPRWIPVQRPMGGLTSPIMELCHPLFDPQGAFLHMCNQESFLWPFKWSSYLYLSRAQLLPLALSLKCLGKTKLQFYYTRQIPAVQPRGPSISYLNNVRGWIVIIGVSVNTNK